ncbi:MAG: hypothetical protein QOE03_3665 [Micromonosporaceae bacterium]|jgi:uncharacterized RDD family membrane protein YckC|nr:hypothetical protein [Micromonosporaceae bacterium]
MMARRERGGFAAPGEVAGAPVESPVPTLLRRFGALLVDWLLCVLIAGLVAPLPNNWAPFVLIVEYGFFVGLFRQTPGMRVTRIACVSYPDGGTIGIPRALLRGVLLALLVPALIMNRQRRGWHDRAAGSIVIDTRPPAG